MVRLGAAAAAILLALILSGGAAAQTSFDDVPPWHWAAGGVERASTAGVFIGHPAGDHYRAANALVQTYEAFANARHPAAVDWAGRFLLGLPSNWPEPLRRSRLTGYRLEAVRIEGGPDRRTATFVAVTVSRANGRVTEARTRLRVEIRRDQDRWRVNYSDLAAGQPLLFR
jgi:hypothetical protein